MTYNTMKFSTATAKVLAAFLFIPAAAVAQGPCDVLNDPCPFALDLECDDPSGLTPLPLQQ